MIRIINTNRNRDLNILDCTAEFMQETYGEIFFKLTKDEKEVYLKCEKGYFLSNFRIIGEPITREIDTARKKEIVDYLTVKKIF